MLIRIWLQLFAFNKLNEKLIYLKNGILNRFILLINEHHLTNPRYTEKDRK